MISKLYKKHKINTSILLKYIIITIIVFLMLLFSLCYNVLSQNLLQGAKEEYHNRLLIAENFITLKIKAADQIMQSLIGTLLVQNEVYNDVKKLTDFLNNFDFRFDKYNAVPILGFNVLDKNDTLIVTTLIAQHVFAPKKYGKDKLALSNLKQNTHELHIGNIRFSSLVKEEILPLYRSITDKERKHMGTLTAFLSLSMLKTQINNYILPEENKKLDIVPVYDSVKVMVRDNDFTVINLLKHFFISKDLSIRKYLSTYNMILELKITPVDIMRRFIFFNTCCLIFLGFIFILGYILFFLNKKFYQVPLFNIRQEIYSLPISTNIFSIETDKAKLNTEPLCVYKLASMVKELIDHYNVLDLNNKKHSIKKPLQKIKANALNFILTDDFHAAHDMFFKGASEFYSNQLYMLVNEKLKQHDVYKMFNNLVDYINSYYNEFNITLIVDIYDNNYCYYYAALMETVFHIFTSIVRMGKFDTTLPVILRVQSNQPAVLPTISIETELLAPDSLLLKPVGYKFGVSYTHTSFLSVYILARKNNLFFHLKEKDNKIIFILESLESYKNQLDVEEHMIAQNK